MLICVRLCTYCVYVPVCTYIYSLMQDVIADAERNAPMPSICNTCLVKQPIRSQHCPVSNRCVARYDSFSTLLATTVGAQNHVCVDREREGLVFEIDRVTVSNLCMH